MAYLIVLMAVLARFAPHPPNFSPVFGALLFGGAYLRSRDAIWYPLALLAASDVVLTTWVYRMQLGWSEALQLLGFGLVALIGLRLRGRISARSVVAASLAGPTVFFLVSNFAVWTEWRLYPATLKGLLDCYVAALPFFRNSLASGLAYTAVLFGGYELYRRRLRAPSLENRAG